MFDDVPSKLFDIGCCSLPLTVLELANPSFIHQILYIKVHSVRE